MSFTVMKDGITILCTTAREAAELQQELNRRSQEERSASMMLRKKVARNRHSSRKKVIASETLDQMLKTARSRDGKVHCVLMNKLLQEWDECINSNHVAAARKLGREKGLITTSGEKKQLRYHLTEKGSQYLNSLEK